MLPAQLLLSMCWWTFKMWKIRHTVVIIEHHFTGVPMGVNKLSKIIRLLLTIEAINSPPQKKNPKNKTKIDTTAVDSFER